MRSGMTKREAIDEITRRLVEYYRPVRIYLFGSEARGDAGPDSDLDFCVVLPDDAPRSLYGPVLTGRFGEWGLLPKLSAIRTQTSRPERLTWFLLCRQPLCPRKMLYATSLRMAA